MRLPYKTVHYGDDTKTKIDIEEIEYCCDEMGQHLGRHIDYHPDPGPGEKPFVGVGEMSRIGEVGELVRFEFCPFCGTEIEIDHLGHFEHVSKEVPIDG